MCQRITQILKPFFAVAFIKKEAPYSERSNKELPYVTPIEFAKEQPIKFDAAMSQDFNRLQFLTEEQVRFVPDSDQYIDREERK